MIEVFFDGACQPNPGGVMAFGVVVYQDNVIVKQEGFRYNPPHLQGKGTNNIAEYLGLISSLKYCASRFWLQEKIIIHGDSRMVIMQMRDDWQINDGAYKPFALQAKTLSAPFSYLSYTWIPRDMNYEADRLALAALNG